MAALYLFRQLYHLGCILDRIVNPNLPACPVIRQFLAEYGMLGKNIHNVKCILPMYGQAASICFYASVAYIPFIIFNTVSQKDDPAVILCKSNLIHRAQPVYPGIFFSVHL